MKDILWSPHGGASPEGGAHQEKENTQMYRIKLGLGTKESYGIPVEEQIRLFKKTGFEAFFTAYTSDLKSCRRVADETGMIFQSVHAPFRMAKDFWTDGEGASDGLNKLLECVDNCAEANVPIIVMHPYIGYVDDVVPNSTGVEYFRTFVLAAKDKNIKVAFENVERREFLDRLMEEFCDFENVGFCWDSGHELCYNRGDDMLSAYGDRLIATHINDNLGVRDYGGSIAGCDDLHLLPFDGITDWQSAAVRLKKCGYDGILTFELNNTGKGGRHENDKYARMPIEEYIAECYARACRVAYLFNRAV